MPHFAKTRCREAHAWIPSEQAGHKSDISKASSFTSYLDAHVGPIDLIRPPAVARRLLGLRAASLKASEVQAVLPLQPEYALSKYICISCATVASLCNSQIAIYQAAVPASVTSADHALLSIMACGHPPNLLSTCMLTLSASQSHHGSFLTTCKV